MDDWNEVMQSRLVRTIFNAIVTVVCGRYAIDAVRGIIEPNEAFMETLGSTGYYALMVVQAIVCVWVSVVFVLQTVKLYKDEGK